MGDHRASIKITFEMHGVKRECDMWVNYIPESDARGVGESVFMFFEKAYADAMQAWYEEIDDYEDRKKAEIEASIQEQWAKTYPTYLDEDDGA